MVRLNSQGGVVPESEVDRLHAMGADLITFPRGIKCVSCANCLSMQVVSAQGIGYCSHPEVQQPVSVLQCCNFWSATGTKRDF